MISDPSFVVIMVGLVTTLLVLGLFVGAVQYQDSERPYRRGR